MNASGLLHEHAREPEGMDRILVRQFYGRPDGVGRWPSEHALADGQWW